MKLSSLFKAVSAFPCTRGSDSASPKASEGDMWDENVTRTQKLETSATATARALAQPIAQPPAQGQALARAIWPEATIEARVAHSWRCVLNTWKKELPKADDGPEYVQHAVRLAVQETNLLESVYDLYAQHLTSTTMQTLAGLRTSDLGALVFDRYETTVPSHNFADDTPADFTPSEEHMGAARALYRVTTNLDDTILSDYHERKARALAAKFTASEIQTLQTFLTQTPAGRDYAHFIGWRFGLMLKLLIDTQVVIRIYVRTHGPRAFGESTWRR